MSESTTTSQPSTSSLVRITLNYRDQQSQQPPLYSSPFSSTSSPSTSAHVTSHTSEQAQNEAIVSDSSIPHSTTTGTTDTTTINDNDIPMPYLLQQLPLFAKSYEAWDAEVQSAVLSTLIKRSTKPTLQLVNSLIHPILKRDFLACLPYELRLQIISYLDVQSLCEAAHVSKTWYSLIYNDQQTWYRLLLQDGFVIPTTPTTSTALNNSSLVPTTAGLKDNSTSSTSNTDVDLHVSSSSSLASGASTTTTALPTSSSPSRNPKHNNHRLSMNYQDIYRSQYTLKMNWKYGRFKRTSFDGHTDNIVTSLQFDEHKIVSGATDSLINVYSTRDPQHQRFTLSGHEGGVWALQYVGNTLVSGSVDRTVRVWDLEKRKCTHIFKGHTSTVRCLLIVMPVVTASGKKEPTEPLIVTGARDSSIRVWRLPDLTGDSSGSGVDKFFEKSTASAPTTKTEDVEMNDVETTTTTSRVATRGRRRNSGVPFGEQDSSPSTDENDDEGEDDDDDDDEAIVQTIEEEERDEDEGNVDEEEDDDDEEREDDSFNDENRDPSSNEPPSSNNNVNDDNNDGTVFIGDGANPWFKFLMVGHTNSVRSIAAYGNTLISGSYDNTVGVWNLETGRLVHRMEGHTSNVYSVVIDPPRQQCMSGSMDSIVYIWDYVTGECLHKLDGHSILVGLLGLTPNYLVSAAADRTLRVWDPNTGVCEHVLAGKHGHEGAITCFKHDEEKVISGSEGGLKIWDIKTGKFMYNLVTGVKGVWWLTFNRSKCVVSVHDNDKTWFELLDFDVDPASFPPATATEPSSTAAVERTTHMERTHVRPNTTVRQFRDLGASTTAMARAARGRNNDESTN